MKYSKRDESSELKNTFASNLRHQLMINKMTQVELGIAMNTAQSAVNAWCSGESMPSLTKIKGIARILHCDIDSLINSASERGKTDAGLLSDPIFKSYVQKLYYMDRDSQRTMFFMIDKFSSSSNQGGN